MIWPKFISMLLTWAMKMAASASYRAVPSMLMVAPTGNTKRVIRLSILLFSSRHLKVTGRVAELGRAKGRETLGCNYCSQYCRALCFCTIRCLHHLRCFAPEPACPPSLLMNISVPIQLTCIWPSLPIRSCLHQLLFIKPIIHVVNCFLFKDFLGSFSSLDLSRSKGRGCCWDKLSVKMALPCSAWCRFSC